MVASIFWICSWPVVSSRSALMAASSSCSSAACKTSMRLNKTQHSCQTMSSSGLVRMRLRLSLAVWPDGLLLFAHDQDTDVFQVLEHLSDGGEPPQAIL